MSGHPSSFPLDHSSTTLRNASQLATAMGYGAMRAACAAYLQDLARDPKWQRWWVEQCGEAHPDGREEGKP